MQKKEFFAFPFRGFRGILTAKKEPGGSYESHVFCSRYRCTASAGHLLGALVGLARSTVNEPKTEDTDRILAAGLRLAADPEAAESALLRMTTIVEAEKHRVAPNCAACAMPCGNTSNYDLARLWGAPAEICALKVRLLSAVCVLAGQKTTAQIQKEICDDLFVLAEDWDAELLLSIVTRAEGLCVQ